MTAPRCSCAHYDDGSTNTSLCPVHSTNDPCATMAAVTGKRRRGSVIRGTCTNCSWTAPPAPDSLLDVKVRLIATAHALGTLDGLCRKAAKTPEAVANEIGTPEGLDTAVHAWITTGYERGYAGQPVGPHPWTP